MKREYRGWQIEGPLTATQVGYSLPDSRQATSKVGIGTSRKMKGWLVQYPDSEGGGAKWADSLADAKRVIDSYLS